MFYDFFVSFKLPVDLSYEGGTELKKKIILLFVSITKISPEWTISLATFLLQSQMPLSIQLFLFQSYKTTIGD